MRFHDLTGQKSRLKMCLGCIRMRLQYLTGENIRFKMHLGYLRNGPFPPLTHSINELNCRNGPFPPMTHSVNGPNGPFHR